MVTEINQLLLGSTWCCSACPDLYCVFNVRDLTDAFRERKCATSVPTSPDASPERKGATITAKNMSFIALDRAFTTESLIFYQIIHGK